MTSYLILFGIFAAVTILAGAIIYLLNDGSASATEDRLEILTGKKSARAEDQGIMKEDLMDAGGGITRFFAAMFKGVGNVGLFFEQADSPIRPDMFLLMTAGCLVLGVGGGWASRAPLPLWPVFAIGFALMPLGWLWFRRSSRFKRFAKQLPDAMELIARALRSGHSLNSGINVVVEEMPSPIATEFMLAYEEQNLGIPIEIALKNMLKRMPNMDLKFFVTAVTIQKQSGGDLSEILDKIGYIIRERFKIMGQVMALTGEGRISGVVLQAMPVALFLILYYMNPDYVMLLFQEDLGKEMLFYAVAMQIMGAFVIKKIVAIKV
ncbi:MAG: type II secretion system F family protein [Planctomycetota bacterium]|nr:type II secretion system F family protein [Planctomycetota bacterium]MDA1164163.1 type II secretion system F family protein [Planctomycetota bacterium]